ncbi:MAG: PD-(D/E)XK motif protein, partial [Paracoccaceae bacterium]
SQAVVFGAPEAVFLELPQPTGLMLRLPSVPDPLPKLPKLKNLVVSFRPTVGGSAFVLGLKERAQVGIFETLCRDVVSAGEGGESREDALCRAIQRTRRGHHLLRGGRQGGLSVEEQRGLVGELEFLRELVSGFAPETAIETWTGPTGSAKDFELIGACVEVTIVHLRFSFGEAVMLVDGVKRFEIGTDIGVALQPDNLMLFDSDGRNISERKPD